MYYTYIGSCIIRTNTRGVKLFLAKVNGEIPVWNLAENNGKLDTLHKFWEWENRYQQKWF